jgi:curved DNA-binding protein CbpA
VADAPDPYKILQVDPEAEDEVIQAAYRRIAQKYHPDRSTGQEAIDRMVAINAAWETIGDPKRRASFDQARDAAAAGITQSWPQPAASRAREARPGSPPGHPPSPEAAGAPPPVQARPPGPRPPDVVSRDWTPGRSTIGGGYDAKTMRAPEGFGAAGPAPGNPSGSILNFGRYAGWSLGEVGRADLEYIEWLDRMPIGRPYRDEIDGILRRAGRRKSAPSDATQRRGLFRRR